MLMVDPTHTHHMNKRYRVQIDRLAIQIRKVKLSEQTNSHILNQMKTHPARYFLTHAVTKHFYVPENSTRWSVNRLFSNTLPSQMIVVFQKTKAFQGAYDINRYAFTPEGLREIAVYINGELFPNPIKITSYKTGSDYIHAYLHLLRALRLDDSPSLTGLDAYKFRTGPLSLFCFDFSPDRSDASYQRAIDQMSLELAFEKVPTGGLTGICIGLYNSQMSIQNASINVFDSVV